MALVSLASYFVQFSYCLRENTSKESPFLCYLAYNAVHGPLRTDESKPASAPEARVNKALDRGVRFLRSDYVAILERMDHNIGRLVDLLGELGVAENTLIVFVSDNGGCTMEEGRLAASFLATMARFGEARRQRIRAD